MKIHISALLLNILVLVNFCELSAMENGESSSKSIRKHGGARPGGGRPRGSKTRRVNGEISGQFQMYVPKPVVREGTSKGSVEHKGQLIDVWRDRYYGIVRTEYQGNHCPTGLNYGKFSYLLLLAILPGNERIVECLDEHGKLLGVRPWTATAGNYMQPSSTHWFFVYLSKIFRVMLDSKTKAVINVILENGDGKEVTETERGKEVYMAGYIFAMIKSLPDHHIVGAKFLRMAIPRTVVKSFSDLIS